MASKAAADVDTDDGSLTPSEPSDGERSEHDSDYETEHEEETEGEQAPNVVWTGYGKKTPVILFKGEAVIKKKNDYKAVGERYHMAFKMGSSDCRIVRTILNTHGLREVHPNSSDYNIMWTGSHLKPFTLRSLTEFQKVNHFPRSYEITRKDRLFKNVQRMQQIKGTKHFDFVAQSFIMPTEYQEFCSCFIKEKGTWIVKPVASSRGRGVFLVNHPDQVPLDENVIVSKYIANPILIDGFKFDVRLYVAVTSYDPIVIYLYEEGLTRFATVKYEKANKHLRNQCMHLTNYSVNKKNKDYVQNDDPDIEDYGNKWSMGALLRYLKSQKKDVTALMMRIEDVIIKTIMSAEMPIATACKMFMPFRGNCFELYGFDILIDDHLKPWVLEVNLSPSLACDAPLDLKIKANMISDLLSLSGLMCQDPVLRSLQQSRRNHELSGRIGGRIKSAHIRALSSIKVKPRPQSAGGKLASEKQQSGSMAGLTGEEIKIVRRVKEEEERKGGWVRIFPSPDSWDLYGPLLQFSTTHNAMLHQRLYPERHKGFVSPLNHKSSATSIGHRNKLLYSQLSTSPLCKLDFTLSLSSPAMCRSVGDAYGHALLRTRQYLRKLNGGSDGRKKQRRRRAKSAMERRTSRRPLAQGLPEEDGEGEGEETDGAELEPPVTSETSTQKQTQAITCAKEDKGLTKQQKITAKLDVVDQTAKPQPQVQVQEQAVSTPKLNVMEMLVQGEGALNKVQARTAFAMYLIRVHQRLLSECNSHSVEDVEAMNEQMDLVLRFLKRAAVNLHQTFKVIVPSRKLPLNERRRILAKQLSDFVHVYTKETEQLRNKAQGDKKSQRNSTSKEGINEEKFERFINIASETELEEVLTTYTKLNKSASIFLGTKSTKGGAAGETSKPESGHGLAKRKDISTESNQIVSLEAPPSRATPPQALAPPTSPAPAFIGWEETPDVKAVLDSLAQNEQQSLRSRETGNMLLSGKPYSAAAACNSPAAAAFAKAVAVYSAKLTRSRPSSASSNKSGVRVINHRPASANSTKSVSAGKPPLERGYVDVYNEKAINEALQRLAHRQQARQYSATNSTVGFSELPSNVPLYRSNSQQSIHTEVFRTRSLSTGDTSTTDMHKVQRHTNDRSHVHQPDAPQGKYITLEEHRSSLRPPSRAQVRAGSLKTANATFNSFIEDKGPSWQSDLALAYNQITGSSLNHFGVGSQGNRSYKVAQQQQLAKQQRMMAQSKALLESSKAKHLAMVAQAHAAQLPGTQGLMGSQASLSSETSTQPYEPKPPTRPVTGKKVNNHFRVARPLTLEVGAGGDKHINPDTFQLSSHLVSSSISGAKLLTQ